MQLTIAIGFVFSLQIQVIAVNFFFLDSKLLHSAHPDTYIFNTRFINY